MKLAYFAYSRASTKAHRVLEQYFDTIDTYLYNTSDEIIDYDLQNLSIMADHVIIPNNIELLTTQHKIVLQKIKNEYQFFKKNILLGYNQSSEDIIGTSKSIKKIYNISDVSEMTYDSDLNKHIIFSDNNKQKEYDYLIIESNEFIGSKISNIKQNVISRSGRQSHIILNLEFGLQGRVQSKQHLHHEFILVDNVEVKTVFDNWYICSLMHNKILVSQLIPFEKYHSEEFLDFITSRTFNALVRNFDTFIIDDLVSRYISTCDGFYQKKIKLNYPKNSAALPSFLFWSQNKVNDYINNMFILKNKKNRNLFDEKGNV